MKNRSKQQTDIVYRGLLEDISNCVYLPGEFLVSSQVAERFNTSRTPVREALFQLKNTGIVEIIPHRGARVRKVDVEELFEMYMIREALEPLAVCEMIKRKPNEEVFERLTAACTSRLQAKTMGESASADKTFHEIILQESKLKLVSEILQTHMVLSKSYLMAHQIIPANTAENAADANEEHRIILEAIRAGNAERAMKALQEHNHRAIQFIRESVRQK